MRILAPETVSVQKFAVVEVENVEELSSIDRKVLENSGVTRFLLQFADESLQMKTDDSFLEFVGSQKIGYSVARDSLNAPPAEMSDICEHRLTEAELSAWVDFTYEEAAQKRMSFVTKVELTELKAASFRHGKEGRYLALSDEIGRLAFAVTCGMSIADRRVSLISWIWIRDNIDASLKKNLRNKILQFFKQSGESELFASVYSANSRSRSFFTSLGFGARCLFINI